MPEIGSLAGIIGSIVAAIGALPLANFSQERREKGLHDSFNMTSKTLEEAHRVSPSNKTAIAESLERTLLLQAEAIERSARKRTAEKIRNAPSLAAGVTVAAILSIPIWIIGLPDVWWERAITGVLAAIVILLVVVSFFAYFLPPRDATSS